MSTNFYLEFPSVVDGDTFTPARRLHVCRSCRTWAAYGPSWRREEAGEQITSTRDWWSFLERSVAAGAVLHDEYGRIRSVEYLREWAESLDVETRAATWKWVQDYRGSIGVDEDRYWLDDAGFTMYDGVFS